jgi:hypothetical protein
MWFIVSLTFRVDVVGERFMRKDLWFAELLRLECGIRWQIQIIIEYLAAV